MSTNGDLNIEIGAKLTKLESALKLMSSKFKTANEKITKTSKVSANKTSNNWTDALGGVGIAMAGAFSTAAMVNFAKESFKMAAQLEGIKIAFDRIAGQRTFEGLQKATKGTVSQLQLMKATVQASNFQIPVEKLGKLFEFARRRAKETGESVDYLVNSIVTGIGRKSPLILDNLGISAVRLRKELKGVGVEAASVSDITEIVGRIAQEEMEKMGKEVKTSADEVQQLTAKIDDLKIAFGQRLVTAIGGTNGELSKLVDHLTIMIQKGELIGGGLVKELEAINNFTYDSTISRLDQLIAKYGSVEEAIKKIDKEAKKMRDQAEIPIPKRVLLEEGSTTYNRRTDKIDRKNKILLEQAKAYEQVSKELKLNIKNEAAAASAADLAAGKTAAAAAETAAAVSEAAKEAAKAKATLNAEAQKEIDLLDLLFKHYVQYQAALSSGGRNAQILPNNVTSLVIPEESSAMADAFSATADEIENLDVLSTEFFNNQNLRMSEAANGAQLFGNALTAAFVDSMQEGGNFGKILGKMLEDMIKQLVAATLAALALSAVMSAFGLGGFGVAAGGGFSQLLKGSFGSLTGIQSGKVNTSAMNGVSQGQNITLSGKIKGRDIVLVQEKATNIRTRERGF
jgi:hypothetical protein